MTDTKITKIAPDKNWLEWTVFGISFLLLLALLTYLVYRAFSFQTSPPALSLSFALAPNEQNQNRYQVTVHNRGGQTAENVTLELQLHSQTTTPQKAQLEIPFCPVNAERSGWVIFEGSPSPADSVIARIVSYKKP